MIQCPSCHAPLAAGETICPHCGRVLTAMQTPVASASQPTPTLRAGQIVANGRYVIDRPLSRGGMGALYLASDREAFDRPVVIKTLIDYYDVANPAEVRDARERFIAEARMLATVKYPTIPQIFAHFQDGPHTCIVMEYVEGRDLSRDLTRIDEASGQTIAGRAYDLARVTDWGIEVCRKLEYLASRQPPIVHHDIKPANLVLDKHSDALFLVDFGTAQAQLLLAPGKAGSGGFGTPGYAAPEQYKGLSEPRSDVYALAATLYHLASDDDPTQHPFTFPLLHELDALGEALMPALEREVHRRPYAVELRSELEKARRQLGQPRPQPQRYAPPPPLRRSLIAPDGAVLANRNEIVGWCVNNWQGGSEWLFRALPQQLERELGEARLAHEVEAILRSEGNPDRALDAALAVIDPYGFGTSGARIDVDRSQLDFGNSHIVGKRWLIVTNRGPRFAALRIETPQWLVAAPDALRLHAGEQATIELVTRPGWAAQNGALNERIAITDEQGRLVLEVQAEFFVDSMSTNWKPSGMIYISIVVLVLLFALAVRWPFGPVFALVVLLITTIVLAMRGTI